MRLIVMERCGNWETWFKEAYSAFYLIPNVSIRLSNELFHILSIFWKTNCHKAELWDFHRCSCINNLTTCSQYSLSVWITDMGYKYCSQLWLGDLHQWAYLGDNLYLEQEGLHCLCFHALLDAQKIQDYACLPSKNEPEECTLFYLKSNNGIVV